jgi:hypothetical protein
MRAVQAPEVPRPIGVSWSRGTRAPGSLRISKRGAGHARSGASGEPASLRRPGMRLTSGLQLFAAGLGFLIYLVLHELVS